MLVCLAGPAAEANHTHLPADTAASDALALSYAERIGAPPDKALRWLDHVRARRFVRDKNMWPVVEAVAAQLLRTGTVSKADVARVAPTVVPNPPFWRSLTPVEVAQILGTGGVK